MSPGVSRSLVGIVVIAAFASGCSGAAIPTDVSGALLGYVHAARTAASDGDPDQARGYLDELRALVEAAHAEGELPDDRREEILAAADAVGAHLDLARPDAPEEPDAPEPTEDSEVTEPREADDAGESEQAEDPEDPEPAPDDGGGGAEGSGGNGRGNGGGGPPPGRGNGGSGGDNSGRGRGN